MKIDMWGLIRNNNFVIFIIRMLALYMLWGACRIVYGIYNISILGPVEMSDMWGIIKGGFVFDTVSILYVNIPFIIFSLLPCRIREKEWYGAILLWLFVVVNALALLINIADICYFPFKLTRIASDDLHFAGEDNFASLIGVFVINYWGAVLLWIAIIAALVWIGRTVRYTPFGYREVSRLRFYLGQTLLFVLVGGYVGVGVRGFVALKGTFPIVMSDATNYARPELSSLVLSNPFCLIRTIGKDAGMLTYMPQKEADIIAKTRHEVADSVKMRLEGKPNVVILILESFGASNVSAYNKELIRNGEALTPNLDKVLSQSYLFTNAYHNGIRSMDALPSIWASIPSYKVDFLALPQSSSTFYPMPAMLKELGYSTQFMHGGARETMSFQSFGRASGVDDFYARPEYEKEHGTDDFDGFWGTFDHAFLPFCVEKMSAAAEPFMTTIFTVSSHHPYVLPKHLAADYKHIESPFERSVAYADYAIGLFFEAAAKTSWFNNTIFVITADHGTYSAEGLFAKVPYSQLVPLALYTPGGMLPATQDDRVMQHLDIMPTLMPMLGYDKPLFGFGVDVFNSVDEPFALFHKNATFNFVVDSTLYIMTDTKLLSKTNYKSDVAAAVNLPLNVADSVNLHKAKAYIQQYYSHLRSKTYKLP